jgi:flavin reductase (DIM6/NTAB) family NADH-FMN oxidoreductase RutF
MLFETNKTDASDLYKLLTGIIIPRPIGWISTIDGNGISNLAPFSYFNMVSSDPPCVMFSTRRDNNKNKDLKLN